MTLPDDIELRQDISDIEMYTKDGEAIDFIHPEHLDKIMELVNKYNGTVDLTKPKVNLIDIASPNMTPEASKVVSDALERSAEVMNRVTTDHTGGNQMTNYNERLDELLDQLSDSSAARGWLDCKSGSEDTHPRNDLVDIAKQSITSLTKELVAEAKPERQPPMKMGNPTKESSDLDKMIFAKKKGHNEAIDQFEQNLLKALEEV